MLVHLEMLIFSFGLFKFVSVYFGGCLVLNNQLILYTAFLLSFSVQANAIEAMLIMHGKE